MCASNVRHPTKKAFHFPEPKASACGHHVETAGGLSPDAASAPKKPAQVESKSANKLAAFVSTPSDVKTTKKTNGRRKEDFEVPESDLRKLSALKQRCADVGLQVNITDLIRAGVAMLEVASLQRLVAAVKNLEPVGMKQSRNKTSGERAK